MTLHRIVCCLRGRSVYSFSARVVCLKNALQLPSVYDCLSLLLCHCLAVYACASLCADTPSQGPF